MSNVKKSHKSCQCTNIIYTISSKIKIIFHILHSIFTVLQKRDEALSSSVWYFYIKLENLIYWWTILFYKKKQHSIFIFTVQTAWPESYFTKQLCIFLIFFWFVLFLCAILFCILTCKWKLESVNSERMKIINLFDKICVEIFIKNALKKWKYVIISQWLQIPSR